MFEENCFGFNLFSAEKTITYLQCLSALDLWVLNFLHQNYNCNNKIMSPKPLFRNRSNFLGTKFTIYDAHPAYDVTKSRSGSSPRVRLVKLDLVAKLV